MNRRPTARRRARALATTTLLVGAVAAIGAPAHGQDIRTTTGLGGYSISANGAPFKVLIDDPSNPLPRPEGEAIVEADPSFTLAEVATGPASRGLASSLWPGNLLGTGLGAASDGQAPNYPVIAQARYPDKPYLADDRTGGNLMHGEASGLDALATATRAPSQIGGSVDIGTTTSTSTATVTDKNIAIGRSVAKVSDISLLGAIKIGSVSTVVETRSDGKKQTASGTTTVAGLTVAGMSFVVDEQGAHQVGGPGTGPVPLGQADALKQAGITISGIGQTTTNDVDGVRRDAKGLRITVDTTLYRKALSGATPGPVTDALYSVFGALPLPPQAATYRSFLYYTLSATPKISFVIGAGQSYTVANLPIGFDVIDTPPLTGGGGGDGGVTTALPPSNGGIFPPSSPIVSGPPPALGPDVAGEVPAGAAVAPPPAVTSPDLVQAAAPAVPDPFAGVSALLVLGALAGASLAAMGLLRLRAFALAGALPVAGPGCALGAPSSVPDLRAAPGALA